MHFNKNIKYDTRKEACVLYKVLYAKESIVANELIRERLLDFLAEKYEVNGGGFNQLSEFYSIQNLSEADIKAILSIFCLGKLINLSLDSKLASLTPEGYSVAKPNDVSVKKTGNINVSFNAPVTGSPIAVGSGNASIIHNSEVVDHELALCIEKLREEIKSIHLSIDEQDKKLAVVDQIERLIESDNPDTNLINTLLDNALPITANITSLIASISTLLP